MKTRLIIGCILMLAGLQPLLAQEDSTASGLSYLTLDLQDLQYPVDSSRVKMISAGRISKSPDELPLCVYVISREDILKNQYRSEEHTSELQSQQ